MSRIYKTKNVEMKHNFTVFRIMYSKFEKLINEIIESRSREVKA